ncbi:MAG: hypothetical protein ACR2PR_12205 [Pseudohongiellaceae bacterium]
MRELTVASSLLFLLLSHQLVYAQAEDETALVLGDGWEQHVGDGWQQYMNYDLEEFLIEQFSNSEQMVIYYAPESGPLYRNKKKEKVFDLWEHYLVVRCWGAPCDATATNKLERIALHSIPLEIDCSLPFNKAVRLLDKEQEIVTELYFDTTGHCFTVGNKSYYSKTRIRGLHDIISQSDISSDTW